MRNKFLNMTYWSLFVLSFFSFISFSVSALSHILIIPPSIYFSYQYVKERKSFWNVRTFSLLILILTALVSIFVNFEIVKNPFSNLKKIKYFLIGLMAIPAYIELVKSNLPIKKWRLLINGFLFSTGFASLAGMVALALGYNYLKFKPACEVARACGMYGMSITYGYGIALVCTLLCTLIFFRKKLTSLFNLNLLYISTVINILGLYFSYSRGALLGFLASLLVLVFYKNKKIFAILSLLAAIGLGGIIYLTKSSNFENRYLLSWNQGTNILRIHQALGSFYAFKDNPLTGVGFRNFEYMSVEIKEKYGIKPVRGREKWNGHAHNNYLEFLAGCGLFAFLAICFWHLSWGVQSIKNKSITLKIFGPFVISLIVTGMFQSTIIDGENTFIIMAAFGIYEALSSKLSSEQKA